MRIVNLVPPIAISLLFISACAPQVANIEPRKTKALRAVTYETTYFLMAQSVAENCPQFSLKVPANKFFTINKLIVATEGITRDEFDNYMSIEGYRMADNTIRREAGRFGMDFSSTETDFCALGHKFVENNTKTGRFLVKSSQGM